MASGGEAAAAGSYAPPPTQINITQQDVAGVAPRPGCGTTDVASTAAQNGAADLAAAYSSFAANTPEAYDASSGSQGMLSNLSLGMLGLLPQPQSGGGVDPSGLTRQHGDSAPRQDAMAPQPSLLKPDPDSDAVQHNAAAVAQVDPHTAAAPGGHPHHLHHPHHPAHMMHVQAQPRAAAPQPRWVPPAINPAHWEYGGPPQGMVPQQLPHPNAGATSMSMGQAPHGGQQAPSGPGMPTAHQHSLGPVPHMQQQQHHHQQVPSGPGTAPMQPQSGTANGAAPGTAVAAPGSMMLPPQPGASTVGAHPPGGQLPIHHPGAATAPMRSYAPYGPYGEPCPYPPHTRQQPPAHYPHPGMPGPHGGMMPYHPGYPPMHPHMPHRGPYYPHDTRYPPMGAMHPAYPPPSGYYRGHHPGMPPPPHPAYHYMPPPYGGHHPGMHPGMYMPMPPGQGGPAPGGQPSMEPHPRDGAASAASGGTAVCAAGSDGGTDPVSAARQAAKLAGSSGGSESEDVGLEAVITLRPGMPEQEDASGAQAAAAAAAAVAAEGDNGNNGAMQPGPNGCVDGSGRPLTMSGPNAQAGAPPPSHGPDGELLSDGGGMSATMHHMHSHTHQHKMTSWPYGMMAPPPPPSSMPGPMPTVGGYEWAPVPPPPAAVMAGYTPMHPQGGWMYSYDPLAPGLHHPGAFLGPGDLPDDDDGTGLDLHTDPRRRTSQSSLGGTPLGQLFQPGSRKTSYGAQPQFSGGGCGFPMVFTGKGPTSSADQPQRSGSPGQSGGAPGSIQRSGSLGQLFSALGDGQCFVSRRTQRLKKRRSADAAPYPQHPGGTPDPFALAIVAAERAAAGRDSSTGSGAPLGLPPMFPGSAGGARRSSNGSDRTALLSRGGYPPSNRQRSDPGYLIEGPDPGAGWGGMVGPMAGLGQLMVYPPHMQQLHQPILHQHQQPPSRRTSENGSGGGRAINLPKRFEDAVMTMEYPKGPQQVYLSQRKPGRQAQQNYHGPEGIPYDLHGNGTGPDYPLDDPPYEVEEDEGEGHDADHADAGDDSDEDYEAGAERRVYRGFRSMGGLGAVSGVAGEGPSRKRKMPMTREELPQPEKKRKARDPATISKVVLNCVIILRMVNHELVYEKEIRNALGNNPDTSKALRLLMNQGKLVRTGQGGRGNPFCYRCTPLGISTLQRIEDAATPGADPSAGPNQEQRAAAVAV